MAVSRDLPDLSDESHILMHFKDGEAWSGPYRYSLDRLQEVMDRANAKFGNPEVDLGGPEIISEPPRQLPRTRKNKR